MATNNDLYKPVPSYRKFVDNQVLTDDQLNAMLGHLNYQDQLSRVLLSGVGIVCGMKISYDETNRHIRLTKGAAVTTAGNLLKARSTTYNGFKNFDDPIVKYPPFTNSNNSTIPLWELETDTTPSDVNPLGEFESTAGMALEDAVAVLYLEDYLKEEEDCSPIDCDTQGREVVHNLRVLLISPESARALAMGDTIFSGLLQNGENAIKQRLQHFYARRIVLNPTNTRSYSDFKNAYDVSFGELAGKITDLGSISLFGDLLEESGVNPVNDLGGFAQSYINLQYLFDFYKDLATAYNELIDLLKQNYGICCPDPDAFPKHVLLGSLVENGNPWQHPFYPSPAHHQAGLTKIKSAFLRLLLMIKDFKTEEKNEIIITPSKQDNAPLGRQAIPFYYDLDESDAPSQFYEKWNESKPELTLNYYGYNYPANFDPLNICLDEHDFYRIEGHTGWHVEDAQERIREIRGQNGLPFDVKPIAVGQYADENIIDFDKYRTYFDDLQMMLDAWNEELECTIASATQFLSAFSLENPGEHQNFNSTPSILIDKPKAYDIREIKNKGHAVLANITDETGTIGEKINNKIVASDGKWSFLFAAKSNMPQIDDPYLEVIIADIPIRMMGYMKKTIDNQIKNVENFNEENFNAYILALNEQCRRAKISKKQLAQRIETSDLESKPWLPQYRNILARIISCCCYVNKIDGLYEKIKNRKNKLAQQLIIKQFIKQHPGAEHKAGVPKGGTFVLLYYSTEKAQEEVDVEATAERIGEPTLGRAITGGGSRSTGPVGSTGRIGTVFSTREFFEPRLAFADFNRFRFLVRENIPHGTVIGDLCLPYICCSTTPSTTFVFPEQLATLRLPVDHVCIGEEQAGTVPLTVMPADGKVKAFIQKRKLSNVIVANQNGTYFNPNNLSPDDYGKAIRFEVNGQPVEPILHVFRKPEPGFTYSEEIRFRNNNTEAIVTFQNTSEPFDELTFVWDFAGEIVEGEDALEFTRTFDVQPGQNFDFEVNLTATNGKCTETYTESVNIDVPALPVPDPGEDDCLDVTAQNIKVSIQIMDREFRANQDLLSQIEPSYPRVIRPAYTEVVNGPEAAFSGERDEELFSFIQKTQLVLTEQIGSFNTDITREFVLKIYYELMLLYFYLQACRDDDIVVDDRVADATGNWINFTENAVGQFPKALGLLLEEDDIHKKLVALQTKMEGRFDEAIAKIVNQVIEILNEFHG